ncbi:MAG: hypothetical protein ACXWP1_08130, partial [Bdellovibrionota bacterium]
MRTPLIILLLSLSCSAFADDAPVAIDDLAGCGKGKAPEMAKADCQDFLYGSIKDRDPSAKAAYGKCLAFYESALRVQNTFCSYRMDAVVFTAMTQIGANTADVGQANVSEEKVSRDNSAVAAISKAYLDKLKDLGPKFKQAYQDYEAAIGKMNGGGGTDEVYEATCMPNMVSSPVPGYLRELLATQSHSNAWLTWQSMWTAIRTNISSLHTVKEEADKNANVAQFRAVDVGAVFQKRVENPTNTDMRLPVTPLEGAASGAVQYLFPEAVKRIAPAIPAAGAAIVGGGAVLLYQMATNKVIMYPETIATFTAMLNPVWGIAATIVVAVGRTVQQDVLNYRGFARKQLSGAVATDALDLMELYNQQQFGRRQL